jgi:hypothetical protein
MPYDIRAAVSFVPRSPSQLDRVASYTASTPKGMIVPPVLDNRYVLGLGWLIPSY